MYGSLTSWAGETFLALALGLYTSASMRSAIALYERLGFARVPEYDFQPPGAELITAYRFPL